MSHRKAINHVCSVCSKVYGNTIAVMQCFFSHDSPLGGVGAVPEDYTEMTIRHCLEKIPTTELIKIAESNMERLIPCLKGARGEGGSVDQQELAEALAASVVSLKYISYLFCDVEEMKILVEQYARELRIAHSLD